MGRDVEKRTGIDLSDRTIEQLKVSGERVIFTSSAEKGLQLAVYESGKKSWTYRYTIPGTKKRTSLKIGEYPSFNQDKAINSVREYKKIIQNGIDPAVYANRKRNNPVETNDVFTVDEKYRISNVARNWLEYCKATTKPGTYKKYKTSYNKHLSKKFGNLNIKYFNKLDYQEHILNLPTNSIKNAAHRAMRAMFSYAVEKELIQANPLLSMKKINKSTVVEPRERFLSSEELNKFFNEIGEQDIKDDVKTALKIQLYTGLRIGEILSIKREDINIKQRKITHSAEIMKGNKSAITITSTETLRIILTYIKNNNIKSGRLFRKNLTPDSISKEVAKIRPWINFRTHDLRRTARTYLQLLGCPKETRDAITNHATASGVAKHYDIAKTEEMQLKYLEKLAEKYKEVKEDKNALKFTTELQDDDPLLQEFSDII